MSYNDEGTGIPIVSKQVSLYSQYFSHYYSMVCRAKVSGALYKSDIPGSSGAVTCMASSPVLRAYPVHAWHAAQCSKPTLFMH